MHLMPNHYHLVVVQKKEGGISTFMNKLRTSFSMYFNKRYERTGPLLCRPFRSKHVSGEEYLRWLFSYVHMNPLSLVDPEWEKQNVTNVSKVSKYLSTFKYSSYYDYFTEERDESLILEKDAVPIDIQDLEKVEDMLTALK